MHLAAFDKCVWLLPPSCRALHSVSGPSLAPPCAAGPYMIARGFLGLPAGAVAHAIRMFDCIPKATPLGVLDTLAMMVSVCFLVLSRLDLSFAASCCAFRSAFGPVLWSSA